MRSQPKEMSGSAQEPGSALAIGSQSHQPIPTARSRPASFQSRASMGASPDDVRCGPRHHAWVPAISLYA